VGRVFPGGATGREAGASTGFARARLRTKRQLFCVRAPRTGRSALTHAITE
jgi:hypothetical protein